MIVKKTSFQTGITPYSDHSASALVGQVAHSAILTKIVYATDTRAAWNRSTVSRYYPRTFSLSFEVASGLVEPLRVQGSSWEIIEVPAIAFIGSSIALIVSEINTQNILNDYPFQVGLKPLFLDLAEYFKPVNREVVRLLVDCPNEVKPADAFNRYYVKFYDDLCMRWARSTVVVKYFHEQVSSWCLKFPDLRI